jgi:hypothetical protein
VAVEWTRIGIGAGDVVIALDDEGDVTDAEWNGFCAALADGAARHGGRYDKVFVLVVSDGGSTTTEQRERLKRQLDGQPLRAAVLSHSQRVRHVVNAIGWFARDTRCFAPEEAGAWLLHVPLDRRERAVVRRAIQALQGNVKTKTVARIEPWLAG